MRVEILVFSRQERLLDQRWNRVGGQEQAPLAGVFGQKAAVGGVNARHHGGLVIPQLRIIGQILLIMPDHKPNRRRADDENHRARSEQKPQKPADTAHKASAFNLLGT